jgi:hypothetical protein
LLPTSLLPTSLYISSVHDMITLKPKPYSRNLSCS